MMIFNIDSFLTFSLALCSLDAVTAISVPQSVDGGQLNRRDVQDVDIKYFDVPDKGFYVACGNFINANFYSNIVALPPSLFDGGSHCNKTINIGNRGGKPNITVAVVDQCDGCRNDEIVVNQGVFLHFASSLAQGVFQGSMSLNY